MSFSNFNVYRKKIFHYTELVNTRQRIGVRQAYLELIQYRDISKFREYSCRLEYVIPSQERRVIRGATIKDLFELSGEEAWAYDTVLKINDARVNGTFNWPDYEYYKDITIF
jgi:hypothetical protein